VEGRGRYVAHQRVQLLVVQHAVAVEVRRGQPRFVLLHAR
jgi:hypothetical protein